MSAPYDDAADVYAAGSLWPIPVAGKNPPVKGATGYKGVVTFEKIAAWTHPDPRVRASAGRYAGFGNVALRHRLTVAIDVDHGYGGKDGVARLAKLAAERALPPLPGTWSSTARGDDSPSRQYLYRLDADEPMKTKPCPSVELCNWHHRFTVCAPSIHPDTGAPYFWYLPGEPGVPPTWGERTTRYPRADYLPLLPAEWVEVFCVGAEANADTGAAVVALPALLKALPSGPPDHLIAYLIKKWSDPARHVGHDEFKQEAVHAILLGREGHPGVRDLLRTLYGRHRGYLKAARPNKLHEADALLNACAVIGQQKPTTDVSHVTDEDIDAFFATFTGSGRPDRLNCEVAEMFADPADRLIHHGRQLVRGACHGFYPAEDAVRAMVDGYRHHGVTDSAAPLYVLKLALSAILKSKVA